LATSMPLTVALAGGKTIRSSSFGISRLREVIVCKRLFVEVGGHVALDHLADGVLDLPERRCDRDAAFGFLEFHPCSDFLDLSLLYLVQSLSRLTVLAWLLATGCRQVAVEPPPGVHVLLHLRRMAHQHVPHRARIRGRIFPSPH